MGKIELEKAQRIANELYKKGRYWSGRQGWGSYQLAGWILHNGTCIYCKTDLSDPRKLIPGKGQATDHLLPKSKYPELELEDLNQLPCCSTCNRLKDDFDPSVGVKEGIRLTRDDLRIQETRDTLIQNAKDDLDKKNAGRKPRFDDEDLADWNEAMRKWREP